MRLRWPVAVAAAAAAVTIAAATAAVLATSSPGSSPADADTPPLVITVDLPPLLNGTVGGGGYLAITATGTPPLVYTWEEQRSPRIRWQRTLDAPSRPDRYWHVTCRDLCWGPVRFRVVVTDGAGVTVTSAVTTLTVVPPLPIIITPRASQTEVVVGSNVVLEWTAVGAVAASQDTAPNMTVFRVPAGQVGETVPAPVVDVYIGQTGFGLSFRTVHVEWTAAPGDDGTVLYAVARGACMTNECDLPKDVEAASVRSTQTVLRVVEGEEHFEL